MHVIDTLSELDLTNPADIAAYWSSPLLNRLYVGPKRVSDASRVTTLHADTFVRAVRHTKDLLAAEPIDEICQDMLSGFARDTGHDPGDGELYVILGYQTTTIYTVSVDDRDVSVLCLESVDGNTDSLALLLAHEYTHFVRKRLVGGDIFESCLGQRLVTEGIAESYSRDVAPGRPDADYCIVDEATVRWVRDNANWFADYVRKGLDGTDLMESLFYMFARIDYPVRTGYVYGYDAVRAHLRRTGRKTRDILGIAWQEVLSGGAA